MTQESPDDHQGCRGFVVGVRIALCIGMPKTTDVNLIEFTGWVKRNGELVSCEAYDHTWAAANAGEPKPYSSGWVHYWKAEPEPTLDLNVTRSQMDAILMIAAANDRKPETWFSDMGITDV